MPTLVLLPIRIYTIEKSSGGKKEEIRAASYNHEFCFDCVNRVGKIHAVK